MVPAYRPSAAAVSAGTTWRRSAIGRTPRSAGRRHRRPTAARSRRPCACSEAECRRSRSAIPSPAMNTSSASVCVALPVSIATVMPSLRGDLEQRVTHDRADDRAAKHGRPAAELDVPSPRARTPARHRRTSPRSRSRRRARVAAQSRARRRGCSPPARSRRARRPTRAGRRQRVAAPRARVDADPVVERAREHAAVRQRLRRPVEHDRIPGPHELEGAPRGRRRRCRPAARPTRARPRAARRRPREPRRRPS